MRKVIIHNSGNNQKRVSMKNLSEIISLAKSLPERKISLAGAHEVESLQAVEMARVADIADTILVGDEAEIRKSASEADVDIGNYEIVHESDPQKFSRTAVRVIREGGANALMKGLVSTSDYMRAILDHASGLMASLLLSHIAIFEVATYHKLLAVTDPAISILPDLDTKVQIIKNAISVYHKLGIATPKVACVCAVEKLNSKMPCTVDASELAKMCRDGMFGDAIIEGPFGLDNAIDIEAARLKKIENDVAGDADIVFCPEIVSANVLYKSLAFLAGYDCAAIVLGASVPVILTSRADTESTKFASIALAIAIS